jgi:formylglycine-generating enzyme required for sulfatase activity
MADKDSENMEHQVFISYAREKDNSDDSKLNRQVVDMICSELESEGITYWIDHQYIDAGDKFSTVIKQAMMKSKIMILIVSTHADESDWVNREVHYALNINLNIIPFCIRKPCPEEDFEFLLSDRDWIYSSTTPSKNHLNRLIKAVRRYLPKKPEKSDKSTKTKEQAKEVKKEIREFQEMPEDVRDVVSKGINVEKNKKGFWEADYGDNIVMVYIPHGEFSMGSNDYDDEKPPHNVFLDGYWMGKTEVTVGQFKIFINETGYVTEAEKSGGAYVRIEGSWKEKKDANWKNPYFSQEDKHPVVCVSWNDANAYCDWLSKKTGLKFKLTTEAQWEKAARGEDGRKYPWGNSPPSSDKANFADKQAWLKEKFDWADKDIDDGYAYTSPVGTYPQGASPYDLLDMAGNVWEWCNDWYDDDYYKTSPDKNPVGPKNGTDRVLRGGGWNNDAVLIRCAFRDFNVPSNRLVDVGFRLCQDNF